VTTTVEGNDGADSLNVQAISSPTIILGGLGDDGISVSSDAPTNSGNLDGITSTLTVDAGAGNTNVLVVSDFGGSGNPNITVSSSSVTGFAGAANDQVINYAATGGFLNLI